MLFMSVRYEGGNTVETCEKQPITPGKKWREFLVTTFALYSSKFVAVLFV